LDISDEMKDELERASKRLSAAAQNVKWVRKENIHLTLKFLGEAPEEEVENIKNVISGIAGKTAPYSISLGRLGAFPGPSRPRVIWVGLGKGVEETVRAAGLVEDGLEPLGFPREARPFSGHLTIGRFRVPKVDRAFQEILLSEKIKPLETRLENIVLYQSSLSRAGAVYTPVFRAEFRTEPDQGI